MVGSDSQYEKVCENTCAGKLEKEVSITEVVFSSYWFPGGLLGIERGKGGCDVINEIFRVPGHVLYRCCYGL